MINIAFGIVDHRLQHFLALDKFMKYSCEPVKQVMQSVLPKGSNKAIDYVKVTECGCVLQWKVTESEEDDETSETVESK